MSLLPYVSKESEEELSVLEGDRAEVEINRFNKDFLLNYFVTEAAEAEEPDEAVRKHRRKRQSKVILRDGVPAANPASSSGDVSCAPGPVPVESEPQKQCADNTEGVIHAHSLLHRVNRRFHLLHFRRTKQNRRKL